MKRLELMIMSVIAVVAVTVPAADTIYPKAMKVRTIQDFGAKGDGVTDDTEALRQAMNTSGVTYFPAGTYIVSDTIEMRHKPWVGPAWRGQHKDKVVIKLADKARGFDNPKRIKPVLAFFRMKGHSADMFKFNFADMTVDTGDHRGALAVRFHSNNNGMIRDVNIVGKGAIGLDLSSGHNGPLLVKDVRIDGFDIGLRAGSGPFNSQTVDGLVLRHQRQWGIYNDREALTLRNVDFEGACPFFYAFGNNTLIDATAKGIDAKGPAITAIDRFYCRNLKLSGYEQGIKVGRSYRDKRKKLKFKFEDELKAAGEIREWYMNPHSRGLQEGDQPVSLGLKVPDSGFPAWPDQPETWVLVDDHGANPDDKNDDGPAIQKAIDHAAKQGLPVVAFRANATYHLDTDIRIHGSVVRLQGAATMLKSNKPRAAGKIIVAKQAGKPVSFEGIDRPLGGFRMIVEFHGGRDLYIRRFRGILHAKGPGNVFLHDSIPEILIEHKDAKVWGWQVNPEASPKKGNNIINNGGTLWILGLKTERCVSYVRSSNGARTEVLGGWLYNTLKQVPPGPMFSAVDSELSLAGLAYYNYWGRKFPLTVEVKRNGKDLSLPPDKLNPSIGLFSTKSAAQ